MDVNKIQEKRTGIETALTKARNSLSGINLLALRSLPHKLNAFSKIITKEIQPIYLQEHRQLVLDTLIEPLMVQYNERLRVPLQDINKHKLDTTEHQLRSNLNRFKTNTKFINEKSKKYTGKEAIAKLYLSEALTQHAISELDLLSDYVDACLENKDTEQIKMQLDALEEPFIDAGTANSNSAAEFQRASKKFTSLKRMLRLKANVTGQQLSEHQLETEAQKKTLREQENYYNIKRLTPEKHRYSPMDPTIKTDARRRNLIDKLLGGSSKKMVKEAAEFLRSITAFEEPTQERLPLRRRLRFSPY